MKNFFDSKSNQALPNLTRNERNSFEQNAILSSCISYLEKYNFKNNPFQYFSNLYPSKLNLFEDIIKATKVLKLQLNENQL